MVVIKKIKVNQRELLTLLLYFIMQKIDNRFHKIFEIFPAFCSKKWARTYSAKKHKLETTFSIIQKVFMKLKKKRFCSLENQSYCTTYQNIFNYCTPKRKKNQSSRPLTKVKIFLFKRVLCYVKVLSCQPDLSESQLRAFKWGNV